MATVKDILHTDLRMIGTHETLERAARVFAGEVLGLLIVVENDRLAGVLSERDIVRSLGEGDDPSQTHVFDVMCLHATCCAPSCPPPERHSADDVSPACSRSRLMRSEVR